MSTGASSGRFSALLLEGLDHYRKGRMMEAVRAWEEAYLLEPTNLRAREFLRSALERIHAHMAPAAAAAPPPPPVEAVKPFPGFNFEKPAPAAAAHPWLPAGPATLKEPLPAMTPPPTPVAPPSDPPLEQHFEQTVQLARPSFMSEPAESPRAPSKPPRGPWDDGPSLAIPQQDERDFAGDESSGAWSIHGQSAGLPLPIEAVADDETEVWIRGARELVALNDFSGALELTGKILGRKPNDKDAQHLHEVCEQNLTLMFESKIGGMDSKPRIAIPPDEIIWLNLDPRAGFVLAQIDGEVSFEDLYAICGLKRLDTARILCELLEQGVVAVAGQDRAVAKRAMHHS